MLRKTIVLLLCVTRRPLRLCVFVKTINVEYITKTTIVRNISELFDA